MGCSESKDALCGSHAPGRLCNKIRRTKQETSTKADLFREWKHKRITSNGSDGKGRYMNLGKDQQPPIEEIDMSGELMDKQLAAEGNDTKGTDPMKQEHVGLKEVDSDDESFHSANSQVDLESE